jgi:hypothetical protein
VSPEEAALRAEELECSAVIEELLDTIEDLVQQATYGEDGVLDSMALSAYADGMRLLASYGRLRIKEEEGRRVIGEWVPTEDRF